MPPPPNALQEVFKTLHLWDPELCHHDPRTALPLLEYWMDRTNKEAVWLFIAQILTPNGSNRAINASDFQTWKQRQPRREMYGSSGANQGAGNPYGGPICGYCGTKVYKMVCLDCNVLVPKNHAVPRLVGSTPDMPQPPFGHLPMGPTDNPQDGHTCFQCQEQPALLCFDCHEKTAGGRNETSQEHFWAPQDQQMQSLPPPVYQSSNAVVNAPPIPVVQPQSPYSEYQPRPQSPSRQPPPLAHRLPVSPRPSSGAHGEKLRPPRKLKVVFDDPTILTQDHPYAKLFQQNAYLSQFHPQLVRLEEVTKDDVVLYVLFLSTPRAPEHLKFPTLPSRNVHVLLLRSGNAEEDPSKYQHLKSKYNVQGVMTMHYSSATMGFAKTELNNRQLAKFVQSCGLVRQKTGLRTGTTTTGITENGGRSSFWGSLWRNACHHR
eukprot:TRINITY_DN60768_c0_g1_i3.p1 TRINITY_DN60768_c0_g1~~TRINITY_DN60768_c0_g1_i3.p1  ORF type:complete len:433 (-),score=-5.84 TRINITY_DN60768_c0_g1_i3:322-1620(-)